MTDLITLPWRLNCLLCSRPLLPLEYVTTKNLSNSWSWFWENQYFVFETWMCISSFSCRLIWRHEGWGLQCLTAHQTLKNTELPATSSSCMWHLFQTPTCNRTTIKTVFLVILQNYGLNRNIKENQPKEIWMTRRIRWYT